MTVEICEKVLRRIREHGAERYPDECCGALLGRDDGASREIVDLLPIDNRRNGRSARRRYLVTPEDHFSAEKEARTRALDIVGFYHTHPDHPARPSEFDRENALPWYTYLILSVEGGLPRELTGWQLADDRSRFRPVRIGKTSKVEVTRKT